ncbi:MAG: SDR family NAD(P)-dependent oxidoreductase, partial [Pseudomonadota bacterium]
MELDDKLIIITGAAGGLGQAMAQVLASAGAKLALVDLDGAAAQSVADQLATSARGYALNVADEAAVEQFYVRLEEDFGSALHGLVNNAGITRDGLLVKAREGEITSQMSLEAWQSVIDVNLTGTFLMGRAAARQMVRSNSEGLIVNIASISRAGNMGQSNYAATKAGMFGMLRTWALELGPSGITSNCVAPGPVV